MGEAGEGVGAKLLPGVGDGGEGGLQEGVVDELADGAALVEVVDFNEVGIVAETLLIADGVDVELEAGDVFGLGAPGGFEVDDGGLVTVGALDEVDAAVDDDAVGEGELDVFLDMAKALA